MLKPLLSNHPKFQGILLLALILFLPGIVKAQVTVNASGGTANASYLTLNSAFNAINLGTHTGSISIAISGNTTEPATPIPLNASGQSGANYTAITIKTTAPTVISGSMAVGRGVIELLGSDNITINGSISNGTSRDLTIQNTNTTATYSAVIRLIGANTTFMGAVNNTIKNCKIIGASASIAAAYGIHAGASSAGAFTGTFGTGYNVDQLTIENNEISNAGTGIFVRNASSAGAESDNLIVKKNDIHDMLNSGIQLSYHISPSIIGNRIYNIKNTITSSTTDIQGIFLENKNQNAIISYNEIFGVYNYASGGEGACGLNSTCTTLDNAIVHHNVIYDINTVAGNTTTNEYTDGAFGIRIEYGSNLQAYYNSVNLYGAPLSGTANFNSSALIMTTNNTSIKVQNNIFANKMTKGTATNAVFSAIALSPTQTFAATTIDNNGYFVPNAANYYLARRSSTATFYTDLAAWKTYTTTSDAASYPSVNGNAPFTADNNLTIPAGTLTPLESAGTEISALGTPNLDFNNDNRPKTFTPQVSGVNTKPDIGAYEFNGGYVDFIKPVIGSFSASPALGACTPQSHLVSIAITDASGILSANIIWKLNSVSQSNIAMTNTSGNIWEATIPAQGSNLVEFYIEAADNSGNSNISTSNTTHYRDQYLTVNAGLDKQSTTGASTTLTAENFNFGGLLKITEVLQWKSVNAPAEATYASFIPNQSTSGGNEFIEVSNTGDLAVDASGFILQLVGGANNTFIVPNGTVVAPGQVITFAMGGTTSDSTNLYFDMNITPSDLGSGTAVGYVLKNNSGKVIDVVGTNSLPFSYLAAVGVTTSDWPNLSGSYLNVGSSVPGVQRVVSGNKAVDTNSEADWIVTARTTGPAITVGTYNGYTATSTTAITWSNGTNGNLTASSTGKSVTTPAFSAPGTYTFIATATDGNCSVQDEINVTVAAPIMPVAAFSASPTVTRTGETVVFTDQSANTPATWAWTFTGPGTATYLNSTSATSQNPEVSFSAPGVYTVSLDATNGGGTSTETKTNYITVYWDYCDAYQASCGTSYIKDVVLNTLSNLGTGCSNFGTVGAYSSFLPSSYTTSLMKGNTYSLNVTPASSSSTNLAAWIDFNNNGLFDATENIGIKSSVISNTQATFTFTVPATAVAGPVGLRIRQSGTTITTADACKVFTTLSGETEEYIITLSDRATVDAGMGKFVSPLNNVCANTSEPVIVRLINKGTAALSNVPVTVNVSGAGTANLTSTYNGTIQPGDSVAFTVGTVNTSAGGIFNFSAFTNIAGDGDASNNDMTSVSRNINAQAAAPTATNASFCSGSTATLAASGTGTLRWFDQATGGTLLASGTSFTTPVLTATTNYYVEAAGTPTDKAGLSTTTTASSSYTSSTGYGINFTANENVILKGVYVYVKTANSPVIVQLRNSSGSVLQTAPTVTVANAGVKTYIPLNFIVNAGSYQLTSGNTTVLANDYSSSNPAVKFPLNSSNNEVSITSGRSSTNTTTAYYCFYDLDILVNGCPSTRTMVSATIGASGQWTGTTSNDWNVATNWCSGSVPTATTDVTLPAGLTTYPQVISGTAQVNNLTIASGATFTINGGTLQLAGALTNNGTYSQTSGTLELIGSGNQQLNGIALANLTINGSGAKTLGSDVTVNGAVTMTSGILNTGTYKLILGPTGTISETNSSYVIGQVETVRNLNAATMVDFGGMGIELTPASGSVMPGSTAVRRVTGTQMNGGGPGYSIPRYFDIQSTVNSGLNVNMVFRYLDHEVATFNENNLVLYRSENQGADWYPQTSTVTTANNSIALNNVSGFSFWTAGDATAPLPVELVSFNAIKKGNDALLTWETASEKDSKGFEIQVSTNNSEFRKIGFAESHNGNTLQHYTFTDAEKGKNNTRYYRLKQMDFDGTVSYSPVKAVAFNNFAAQVNVYPNPFSYEITVTVQTAETTEIPVTITDLTGKTVAEKLVKVEKGVNQVKLETANNLPSGIYLLNVQVGAERFTMKLIKQ